MVGIKLYQPEEIICNYVKSWGITDDKTISDMQKKLAIPVRKSIHHLIFDLEKILQNQQQKLFPEIELSPEHLIAVIKMIYLQQKLYNDFNIFSLPQGKKRKNFQEIILDNYKKYQLPVITPAKMPAQSIRVINLYFTIRQKIKKKLREFYAFFKNKKK